MVLLKEERKNIKRKGFDFVENIKTKNRKHLERTKGLPPEFPMKCYRPTYKDYESTTPIVVGMDSGIGNTAFSYLELIQGTDTNPKPVTDFKYGDSYYFLPELEKLSYQLDKQLYLCEKYYDLFAKKPVHSLTYELLPLNEIQDMGILAGVISAQATTNLINATAYMLNHHFEPVPATAIKYCLTGNMLASKEEMCKAAFQLTDDLRLLENNHMADAFAMAFYGFIKILKEDCVFYNVPVPQKFAHMEWNFKVMPLAPWEIANL